MCECKRVPWPSSKMLKICVSNLRMDSSSQGDMHSSIKTPCVDHSRQSLNLLNLLKPLYKLIRLWTNWSRQSWLRPAESCSRLRHAIVSIAAQAAKPRRSCYQQGGLHSTRSGFCGIVCAWCFWCSPCNSGYGSPCLKIHDSIAAKDAQRLLQSTSGFICHW